MWYRNQLRSARERIISMEIKKLELRDRRARQDRAPRLTPTCREARDQQDINPSSWSWAQRR
jgi:hypothetical protein